MHPRTRERVIRVILAALIGSDLSRRELGELAKSLHEDNFSRDLAELLYVMLGHLASAGAGGEMWREGELKSAAYRIVQERRLPKKMLLQLMGLASQEPADSFRSNAPISEILDRFFNNATDREIEAFINILQSADKSDEYLKGIMGRR